MKTSNLDHGRIDSNNPRGNITLLLIFIVLSTCSFIAKYQLDRNLSDFSSGSSQTPEYSKATSYLGVIKSLNIIRNGQKAKLTLLLLLDQQKNTQKIWTLSCNGNCGAIIEGDKITSAIKSPNNFRGLSLKPPNLELIHSLRNESFRF